MILDQKYKDPFLVVSVSLIYGTAGMLERIVTGAYDVVTFPVPVPAEYQPVMTPDTPFDSFKEMTA
jgi:hypothetical protein